VEGHQGVPVATAHEEEDQENNQNIT
jgi:hypothetical protein